MSEFSMSARSSDATLPVEASYVELCSESLAERLATVFLCQTVSTAAALPLNVACSWGLDSCLFTELVCNPIAGARSPRQMQNIGNLLSVVRYLQGGERGIVGERVMDRRSGPIYVTDQALPARSVTSRIHIQKLYIPKTCLDYGEDGSVIELEIEKTHPSGRLLHSLMDQLFDLLKQDPESVPQTLLEQFMALLKVNMGVHPEREDVRAMYRQSLYEEITSCIERRLGDPHLSTAMILGSFGVSRASLYRMFEPYGGVRSYIMQRRVARAVMDLEQTQNERGYARRVADTWGFSSQPNFNRMIQRVYGKSPTRLFEQRQGVLSTSTRLDPRLAHLTAEPAIAA